MLNELELVKKIVESGFFSKENEAYQEKLKKGVILFPKVLSGMDDNNPSFKEAVYFLESQDYRCCGFEKEERRALRALFNEFAIRLGMGAKLENIARNAGII